MVIAITKYLLFVCAVVIQHITSTGRDVLSVATQLLRKINWSIKAKRRKTAGSGCMRHLKLPFCCFKNGFRMGTEAKNQKRKSGAAPATSADGQ